MSVRVACPVCGKTLTSTSIRAHIGTRSCIEGRCPEMKTQREDAARQAKREYDRLYSKAQRKALRDLELRVLGQVVVLGGGGAGVVAVDIPTNPRATPPRSPSATAVRPPSPALRRAPPVRPPSPREPPVIDVSSDTEGDGGSDTCPICLEARNNFVTSRTCTHHMCADCMSSLIAQALSNNNIAKCPICRRNISV